MTWGVGRELQVKLHAERRFAVQSAWIRDGTSKDFEFGCGSRFSGLSGSVLKKMLCPGRSLSGHDGRFGAVGINRTELNGCTVHNSVM